MAENLYENAELETRAVDLLEHALGIPGSGRITAQMRTRLQQLLGTEGTQRLDEADRNVIERRADIDANSRQRIIYTIVQTRARAISIAPEIGRITLAPLNVNGNQALNALVRDANSPDARALAFYYNLLPATDRDPNAFMYCDRPMFERLQRIARMRETYDRLVADEANFNIGPDTGGAPGQQIHDLAHERTQWEARRTGPPVPPAAEMTQINEEIRKLNTSIGGLRQRRARLQRSLQDLDREGGQLGLGGTIPPLGTQAVAENFDRDVLVAQWGQITTPPDADIPVPVAVRFGGNAGQVQHQGPPPRAYSLAEWISDADARRASDLLIRRYRANQNRPPSASDVLHEVIDRSIGGALGDKREAGVRELQRLLTAIGTTTATATPGAPGTGTNAPAAKPKKKGGGFWRAVTAPARGLWDHLWNKRGPLF